MPGAGAWCQGARDPHVPPHGAAQELSAPTITLNDLLQGEAIDRTDFLTMDIKMWEPKALAGFDLQKYRPSLVCIEAHPDVRQTIIDYFWSRGPKDPAPTTR